MNFEFCIFKVLQCTVILKETIVNYLTLRTFEVKLLLNKEILTVRSQYVLVLNLIHQKIFHFLKVVSILGFILRHYHKRFVE